MSPSPVASPVRQTDARTSPAELSGAAAVHVRDLVFAYGRGSEVLRIPELRVEEGERVFLYGPSGSGKTTLLGVLAGVLQTTTGVVEVLGQDLGGLSGRERDAFRGAHVGYIFQMFNLVPYLSVLDNITLPCRISARRRARLVGTPLGAAARQMAVQLGIGDLLPENVTRLSVGQQQRVAAARALFGSPALILADEPTSALDTERREDFLRLLFERCREAESTLVFVSHDRSLAPLFDRTLSLADANRAGQC
jgi:putative ABC transport system ATP-binding protein